MKLAALFSGGKDSAYSIYLAKTHGHEIKCLLSVFPKSDESHLLHHPNIQWTRLQSKSMGIPQITMQSESDEPSNELKVLEELLVRAKREYDIEGIVHGGIKSEFQKEKFNILCKKLDLKSLSPLWHLDSEQYLKDLISSNFIFIITSVSAGGLDDSWLGKKIGTKELDTLKTLSEKFGFNLSFEGGEAETFVVNCPLFLYPIEIIEKEKRWDGYRGRFEILDARLNYNVR
ncbi:MAG: diphthine--ammonia ligase [Nitrosopumilus sp.]|nr:diphthine--ammonia ligase [Nitrosopumilus sp.]MDH3385352.1 diphthine--ammonia ligase [Nitrosopumilus sp.]